MSTFDELTDEEIEANPIQALCMAIRESGLTMTLYGQPVSEDGLRRAALASGVSRLAGEPLTEDQIKAIAKDGQPS